MDDNQNGRGEDPEGDLWGYPVVPQSGDDPGSFEDELVRVLGTGMLMPDPVREVMPDPVREVMPRQAREVMPRQARERAATEGKDSDLGVDSEVDSDSRSLRNGHRAAGRRARGEAVSWRRRQIQVRWVHLVLTAMLGGFLGPAIMVLVLWGGGFQSPQLFVKEALGGTPSSAAGAPSTPPASSTSPATSSSRASISRIVNVYGPENMTSVQVRVGDELVVHLAYPPQSEGRTWTGRTADAYFLQYSAQTSATGPSGQRQHIFTFRVTEIGVGRMHFELKRQGVPLGGDAVPLIIRSVP